MSKSTKTTKKTAAATGNPLISTKTPAVPLIEIDIVSEPTDPNRKSVCSDVRGSADAKTHIFVQDRNGEKRVHYAHIRNRLEMKAVGVLHVQLERFTKTGTNFCWFSLKLRSAGPRSSVPVKT